MFAAFFYLLRQRGLHVSLNEWMTLLEGMEKGLHKSSLTGFYHLCRAIVVKSEVEFDRFDQVFLEFFKDIPFNGDLPEEMLEWLEHPSEDLKRTIEELMTAGFPDETMEELLKLLQERLEEQDAEQVDAYAIDHHECADGKHACGAGGDSTAQCLAPGQGFDGWQAERGRAVFAGKPAAGQQATCQRCQIVR